MGLCSGKPSGGEYGTYTSKVDSWTHDSRSNYMWIRDEDVANIYFVDAIIGEGSMGAVSIVRKKKDGNKSLSSTLRLSSNNVLVDAGSGLAADTDNLPPTPASTQESSQPPSEPSWASSLDLTKLERKFAMKTVAMTRMKKEEVRFKREVTRCWGEREGGDSALFARLLCARLLCARLRCARFTLLPFAHTTRVRAALDRRVRERD